MGGLSIIHHVQDAIKLTKRQYSWETQCTRISKWKWKASFLTICLVLLENWFSIADPDPIIKGESSEIWQVIVAAVI